jgi:hypothetical protein
MAKVEISCLDEFEAEFKDALVLLDTLEESKKVKDAKKYLSSLMWHMHGKTQRHSHDGWGPAKYMKIWLKRVRKIPEMQTFVDSVLERMPIKIIIRSLI